MRSTICSRLPDWRRSGSVQIGLITVALVAAVMLFDGPGRMTCTGSATIWIPDSPDTVVLQLDDDSGTFARLTALHKALQAAPGDVAAATRYAQLALQHYAGTGDARFLGYADGALGYWRGNASPPRSIWMLRGRILQTQHRFRAAAGELVRMLQVHDKSVEGMLLAADAWRRAGDIDAAKSLCGRLGLAGRPDLARFCAADIFLALGQAEKAFTVASAAPTPGRRDMADDTLQWTLAVKADAADAAGRSRIAESYYRQAIALADAGIALHVSYADLLLNDARPDEAMEALAGLPNADAVLLRRTIAAKRLGLPGTSRLRAELRQRFVDADAFRTDRLHLRERALFELYVEDNPDAALAYAADNWEIQKGWEDARILTQAAKVASRPESARAIDEWRRQFLTDAS